MARKARKKRDKKSRKKKNTEITTSPKTNWATNKPKTLKCSTEGCSTVVENCGSDTTSVVCWKCCMNMVNGQPIFVKYEMNNN